MKTATHPRSAPTTLVTARSSLAARIILGVYFVSGFCALLYQTAWQRLLGLFTGADVRSVTVIVAAYLAGLGAGSLIGGVIADRLSSRAAVRLFGLCNLMIAAFALVARLLFYDLLFLRLHALAANLTGLMAASFLTLLIPTTLMGLSLPLLSRALVRSLDEAPQTIGRLEAINIIGAALGALVGGCLLIGMLGFDGASYAGAVLSAVVGVAAIVVAPTFAANDGRPLARQDAPAGRSARLWQWSVLVFLSGFLAIGLQVVWFRLLSVPLESFAYTFAILVALVLLGDGMGTALGARLVRRAADPRPWFMLTQAAVMLYVLGSVLVLCVLSTRMSDATPGVAITTQSFGTQMLLLVVLPLALLLPPNLLIGLTLPFVQKAVQTETASVGRNVGLLQMANLLGNVAGATLTGTLLLDAFGTSGVLVIFALVGLGFALGALVCAFPRPRAARCALPLTLALALAALVALIPSNSRLWAALHGSGWAEATVVEDSTGVTAIIAHGERATLYASGNAQGEVPFLDVHVILGTVPALAHPYPRDMLIIGVGSGGTPYSAGLRPETRSILAVELVGSQLPALTTFARGTASAPLQALFADPRYRLVVGDGRHALAHTSQRFDLIQADAVLPWRAGSGLLYSREFFEQARARLATGGVMAQWMPTERTAITFRQVFPYGVQIGNFMLLGGNEPIAYQPEALLQRLDDPDVRAHLHRGGIEPERVREFIRSQPADFWTPETPRQGEINTDLLPRDEYFLNN
ncbi:MAG: fused MFS/spermidine synthase [Chloroflexaceae bacterium]|nr:fused MFS/spermidine synthase [Chloroflexaceae bacterium]